jgi:hypothetical protein
VLLIILRAVLEALTKRNDTAFAVKRVYRKSGVSCRPFAVYSGPRVLLPRSAQLPLGYSIAQVTHPRVLEHIFNPEFSALHM